jgi:GT2 family glycosyltransferase
VISVVIPAYDALPHYEDCLSSLEAQTARGFEVIWVDSASRDGSLEAVRSRFPHVRVLALGENAGYRRASNAGAGIASGDLIVIANQDVRFDREFLTAVETAAARWPEAAILAPKILDFSNPALVNEAGNTLHFTGLYGSRGLGAAAVEFDEPSTLAAMSGACFAIRRPVWDEAGGFSGDFDLLDTGWHASYEDADLAWRVRLMGYAVRYAPAAVVLHKFERKPMEGARFRSYEWGRWMTLARNYRLSTLFVLLPSLLMIELAVTSWAALRGMLPIKLEAAGWFAGNLPTVYRLRRAVQQTRRVSDGAVLREMSPAIDASHLVEGFVARLLLLGVDLLCRANYAVARLIL